MPMCEKLRISEANWPSVIRFMNVCYFNKKADTCYSRLYSSAVSSNFLLKNWIFPQPKGPRDFFLPWCFSCPTRVIVSYQKSSSTQSYAMREYGATQNDLREVVVQNAAKQLKIHSQ